MKPVVLISCYRRPEFLYYTLQRIQKADHAEKMLYLFCIDAGGDRDNVKIIGDFPFPKVIRQRNRQIKGIGKQSYNVLEGYREACDLSDSFVFNIEDDIMIATNFFTWHLTQHDNYKEKVFCTIATKNNNSKFDTIEDLSKSYTGANTDYQSLGVCFSKQVLKTYILPNANFNYYRNPVAYCDRNFPGSSIGKYFCEQDGLIRRIKERLDLITIFPDVPRAYHAGFYSYNRNFKTTFTGSLALKIDRVGKVLADPVLYRKCCGEQQYYNDSNQCNLDYASTETI
jgi:hypothetical protein